MKNLLLQSRVVTSPVKDPLIGWHQEYFFFYVKLSDLDEWNENSQFQQLVSNPTATATPHATAVPHHYFFPDDPATRINYVGQCLDLVTYEYFRDADDNASHVLTLTTGTLPAAQIQSRDILDSLLQDPPTDGHDTASDVVFDTWEDAYHLWMAKRQEGLTDMSFEDYLATFGVKKPKKGKPELIRFIKEWTYPTNTIDPSNGTPRTALSWAIADRADKDRFFSEPGFIFGVSVTRPKMYHGAQIGTFTSELNSMLRWLPAQFQNEQGISLIT